MNSRPRVAIPLPLSGNVEYVERSLPQYERAVEMAGGDPIRIPLDLSPAETMKLIERCDAVLLPGASADVEPAKYGATRHEKTERADEKRDKVDELLLQDAYNMRKPILGICYGLQILNVYRTGSLVQHIESRINHEAGRKVPIAHSVQIEPSSRLFRIVSDSPALRERGTGQAPDSQGSLADKSGRSVDTLSPQRGGSKHEPGPIMDALDDQTGPGGHDCSRAPGMSQREAALAAGGQSLPVNSSHHQSVEIVGDGLRAVARCPDDGVIEALEGTAPDHFVLAVQWHPERSVDDDEPSRAIFRAFVEAAKSQNENLAGEFESLG